MLRRALLKQQNKSIFSQQYSFQPFKVNARNSFHNQQRSYKMFDKILIANRGEIACRVMRTAKKLGIKTVAVYSVADKNAQFVKLATEAYCIGGPESKTSYLNQDLILQIAKKTGAQAIHPGYGFLSENAGFAERCTKEGVVFIGPPSKAIHAMGSKSESKEIMINAKVPVVPGYHGENQDDQFLLEEAKKIGFPVLIKAVMGGGGKGMKIVNNADEFLDQLASARREAEKSFSDTRVLLEKYITRPRHIEFQVFGDQHDNYVYLFERDCSVQRRHQKIIEEAPSPGLSPEKRKQMGEAAVAAAKAVGYFNAGTVEFIVDQDDNNAFYFMEMNTRLQVEHPVTEMITKQDLVEWQLKVACGEKLPMKQDHLKIHGHAFEARIYAENPDNNFLPQTGDLYYLKPPMEVEERVRVETGVVQGDAVSIYYDPMIAKLVVWDQDRNSSLRLLKTCLDDYHVAGLPTNIEFLKKLCLHPEFIKANVETHFIQKHEHSLLRKKGESVKVPMLVYSIASVATALHEAAANQKRVFAAQDPTSPFASLAATRVNYNFSSQVGFQVSGSETREKALITFNGGNNFQVKVHNEAFEVTDATYCTKENKFTAFFNGSKVTATIVIFNKDADQHFFIFTQHGDFYHLLAEKVEIGGAAHGGAAAGNTIKSPMHGRIVKVNVKEGDVVKKGQQLVVLEAMKMEHAITAPMDGTVARVPFKAGDMVNGEQILVVLQ